MNHKFIAFWIPVLISYSYTPGFSNDSQPLECFKSLAIPTYPFLARSARLTGAVRAHGRIGADGLWGSLEVGDVHRILANAVEDALRASQIAPNCGGKEIEIIFEFTVQGKPSGRYESGAVTFKWPNRFVISVPPAVTQPHWH